ncbi:unnamed protein product [Gordionus sp. m RMFG-2023]
MYCHDNTLKNCNMLVNTGFFKNANNLRIEESDEAKEVNWIYAKNATTVHVSVQKRYRSPKGISLEINNEYSKIHIRLVPLELKVDDLGEIVNISTLVANNREEYPVWIYEKDGIKKEMNGYWLGNLAMLDVQILDETVGIYSLKDKQPDDKSFQVAKLSDYLATNSFHPLLHVKSPDTDAKLINLTINRNVFNFSIEKCVPTGIYRVLIDEVHVAEISLEVKGEIVNIEAHDNSEQDVELNIGKFNITSSDIVKVFYLKDYSQKNLIEAKSFINGNKLTITLRNLWKRPGVYEKRHSVVKTGKDNENVKVSPSLFNMSVKVFPHIFEINTTWITLGITFTPEMKGPYKISYGNCRHNIILFHYIGTKKLNIEDGNKYNETFIFENGKEIEVSGTATFEEDGVKHIGYNYEMQYLVLNVQRTLDRYYDRNIKNPKIFLIKSNGVNASNSQIIVSDENRNEHDFSMVNEDGYLFFKIKPMIRKNISIEIRFIYHHKILIHQLAPVEIVILENKQDSALFVEGRYKSSDYEWVTPTNKSKQTGENPTNRIIIRANDGFDGYIVVKLNGDVIKVWFVISLVTEDITLDMVTKTAIIPNANRFLREDQCYIESLGFKLGNIGIKAKDGYNCDTKNIELKLEMFNFDLYNKSHLFPFYVENHHVVNIRFI